MDVLNICQGQVWVERGYLKLKTDVYGAVKIIRRCNQREFLKVGSEHTPFRK